MKVPFNREEMERRWATARRLMVAEGLDAILATSYASTYWLSGAPVHQFGRPLCVLLPMATEPAMVASVVEREHLAAQAWIDDRRYFWDYNPNSTYARPRPPVVSLSELLHELLEERSLHSARVGFEEGALPASHLDLFRAAAPSVEFRPATQLMESARRVLSEPELALLRAADEVCDSGQEVVIEQLAAGRNARQIWDAALSRIQDMVRDRYPAYPFGFRIRTGLEDPARGAGHSHWVAWDERAVPRQGQVLTTGVDVLFWGYHGNVERTVVVGESSPRISTEFGIMVEANEAAIAAVRPGVRLAAIDRSTKDVFARHGFGTRSGTGLGRGIVGFEANARELGMDVRLYAEAVLEPGMAFSVEPDLLTESGTYRHCNTVIVTQDGAEVDSRLPRGLLRV